jgi:arsenate reductase-like glutaredoxin family protein
MNAIAHDIRRSVWQSDTGFQFVAICCDSCDGAREILEQNDELRWPDIRHYYMATPDKEYLKKIFGFSRVPFYMVVSSSGTVLHHGNKIDWESILSGSSADTACPIQSPATTLLLQSPTVLVNGPRPPYNETDNKENRVLDKPAALDKIEIAGRSSVVELDFDALDF